MDAQLRKERLEAFLDQKRLSNGHYSVVLDHDSELAIWDFFKGTNGRWYGTNDLDNKAIDAPTFKLAKMDLRLRYFK